MAPGYILPELHIATFNALGKEVQVSRQSNANLSEVCFCDVNKFPDIGYAMFLEHGDITLHLDRGEPFLDRFALQGVGGIVVVVCFGWAFSRTA